MSVAVRGLWNIVLSGYPKSGKTMLARRLVADCQYCARVGVDKLRKMLFDEAPPCRDEFFDIFNDCGDEGYPVREGLQRHNRLNSPR